MASNAFYAGSAAEAARAAKRRELLEVFKRTGRTQGELNEEQDDEDTADWEHVVEQKRSLVKEDPRNPLYVEYYALYNEWLEDHYEMKHGMLDPVNSKYYEEFLRLYKDANPDLIIAFYSLPYALLNVFRENNLEYEIDTVRKFFDLANEYLDEFKGNREAFEKFLREKYPDYPDYAYELIKAKNEEYLAEENFKELGGAEQARNDSGGAAPPKGPAVAAVSSRGPGGAAAFPNDTHLKGPAVAAVSSRPAPPKYRAGPIKPLKNLSRRQRSAITQKITERANERKAAYTKGAPLKHAPVKDSSVLETRRKLLVTPRPPHLGGRRRTHRNRRHTKRRNRRTKRKTHHKKRN